MPISKPKTEDGIRIIHDDDGSSGPVKCGIDIRDKDGHGWLQTDRDKIIDTHAGEDDVKLCEDCYVGKVIIRDCKIEQ